MSASESTHTVLYAVYPGPGGPVSRRLDAASLGDALEEIERHGQAWYDDGETDLEDLLDAFWYDGKGGPGSEKVEADIRGAGGERVYQAETDSGYDIWAVPVVTRRYLAPDPAPYVDDWTPPTDVPSLPAPQLVEIENTFHRTHCRLRVVVGKRLSSRQAQRMLRKLCGMHDCLCWHNQTTDPTLALVWRGDDAYIERVEALHPTERPRRRNA